MTVDAQRPKEQVDLLVMLRTAPDTLAALVAGVDSDQARSSTAEGEWSISEIVAHLVDGEQAWFSRVRLMVERDHPRMKPFPNLDYSKSALKDSLQEYRRLRVSDVEFLEKLSADLWKRGGTHSLWGKIDIHWVARHLAAHDAEHLGQIARGPANQHHRSVG